MEGERELTGSSIVSYQNSNHYTLQHPDHDHVFLSETLNPLSLLMIIFPQKIHDPWLPLYPSSQCIRQESILIFELQLWIKFHFPSTTSQKYTWIPQIKDNLPRSSGNSMIEDKMSRGKSTAKRHYILSAWDTKDA